MQNTQLEVPQPSMSESSSSGLSRIFEGPVGWLTTLVVVPALLLAVLMLPPVSLLSRLDAFTYTRIGPSGGAITDSDQTAVIFPPEGVASSFSATLESVPRADFIEGRGGNDIYDAARALPDYLIPKSPLYSTKLRGTEPTSAVLTTPIPNDSLPYETLGVYMWTGSTWEHLPSMVFPTDDVIEARLTFVPDYFMVMQSANQAYGEVAAGLEMRESLPAGATVSAERVAGLTLRGDGVLEGEAPVNNGQTYPIVRNWTGDSWAPTIRTDLINNMLIEIGQQENQLSSVEQTVLVNDYPGVMIDYRGVDAVPSARADYAYLMSRLAERLHNNDKRLIVRVEAPTQLSAEEWDTKGYDWRALGSVVDTLVIPAPIDPRSYQANAEFDALLTFAASEIDRRKIEIEFPAVSIERSGRYLLPKGYVESLQPLVDEMQTEGDSTITMTLENDRLQSEVNWDESLGTYYYTYTDDQGEERTVYVESGSSMAYKLSLLQAYNVHKVSLQDVASYTIDPNVWGVVQQFQNGEAMEIAGRLDVSFSIYDASGNLLANEVRPLENPSIALRLPDGMEGLQVETTIIDNNGRAVSQSVAHSIGEAVAAVIPEGGESVIGASADAADVSAAGASAAAPAITTAQIVNVRNGPGVGYALLGQITPGNTYEVTAKDATSEWWQIEYAGGSTGWVIGSLVESSGTMDSVAIATDIPEVPQVAVAEAPASAVDAPAEAAPEAAAEAPAEAAPETAPVVSAPIPTGAGPGFGYGVQAHMVHNEQAGQVMAMTTGMGFGWVKQQIEWKVFESTQGGIDYGSSDGMVNAANAAGVNLLFSVVNAPAWAREAGFDGSVGGPPADPATYANFVGAMAGKYCGTSVKAIEVWNEQNLHYEWGNKPLNPQEYVNLLAPAYAAIKAACPEMTVVSGALTPAGNNGNLAMDDFTYLEGMFQAGMANYADAIGAHPSGYNVPPDNTWETACEAIQVTGNGFNGACDSPHHSWSFRSTMEGYRNIANVYGASNLRIWPTEFGWAAGGAFNPNYKYADDNDFQEQAEWTVRAYQMMREWGWVGPAFLWNLNFRVVADGTEKAQWGIVDNSWNPLPVYTALRDMPK